MTWGYVTGHMWGSHSECVRIQVIWYVMKCWLAIVTDVSEKHASSIKLITIYITTRHTPWYLNLHRAISTYQTKTVVVLDINYWFVLNTTRKVTELVYFSFNEKDGLIWRKCWIYRNGHGLPWRAFVIIIHKWMKLMQNQSVGYVC